MFEWLKYWRCRLFKHDFASYGTGTVYHQNSKLVKCRRCQVVFFGPINSTFEEFNRM